MKNKKKKKWGEYVTYYYQVHQWVSTLMNNHTDYNMSLSLDVAHHIPMHIVDMHCNRK